MGESMDFWTRYSSFCLNAQVCPLKSVVKHVKGHELACPVESIRSEHWLFLLSALFSDNTLTKVHFASVSTSPHRCSIEGKSKKREKGFPIPYGRSEQNIRNICMSLSGLLLSSGYLVILKLENLPLKTVDCEQLANGLRSSILKVLSLSGCCIEEGGVEVLCGGLQVSVIAWIDFSSCDLSLPDIEAVCKVIKAHKLRRSNEMFEKTLRYQHAVLDEMEGLNRVSLSYNYLQNVGLNMIIESLADDLWVKALDLQHCGIEDDGAEMLLKVVMTNNELEVIDIRLNLIDYGIVQRIEQQLAMNKVGKTIKYFPMPLWEPSELVRRYAAIRKGKLPKKKITPIKSKAKIRVKCTKKVPRNTLNHSLKVKLAAPHIKSMLAKDAGNQTEEEYCSEVQKSMQDMFENMRSKLTFEMKLRKFFMQKYNSFKSENEQLRELLMKTQNDDIYIDQDTYFEIKQTFEKLKIFFDVMKKYGLWEYIAVLGFDETADVIMTENDAQKCMKVKKKESSKRSAHTCHQENENENGGDTCCHCRKPDSNKVAGSTKQGENCLGAEKLRSTCGLNKFMKGDIPFDEKVAVKKIFQEVINSYSGESTSTSKQASAGNVVHNNAKPSTTQEPESGAASCAQMFMKKFSYSNMPKKVKELVSPSDFYKIVKQELDRYEEESQKLGAARQENSSQTVESASSIISSFPAAQLLSKKLAFSYKLAAKDTNFTDFAKQAPVKAENSCNSNDPLSKHTAAKTESVSQSNVPQFSLNSLKQSINEDIDDISISELIARRRAAEANSPKTVPPKRVIVRKSTSTSSSSKTLKNSLPSSFLPEQLEKESFITQLTSAMNSQKITSNASSDEINSSDSVVTASDKMSDSSVSSSSSEQSLIKNSSDQNDSELQKSYIESVSDASTFKDVESISDIEVGSRASSQGEVEREKKKPNEQQTVPLPKPEPVSSSSSSKTKSKSKKAGKQAQPPPPAPSATVKAVPKSSDKSISSNAPISGKGKNKQSGKNRPKGSSKSSSVPSLSDITTVSSHSLNTDSIMKQISESEKSAKSTK